MYMCVHTCVCIHVYDTMVHVYVCVGIGVCRCWCVYIAFNTFRTPYVCVLISVDSLHSRHSVLW